MWRMRGMLKMPEPVVVVRKAAAALLLSAMAAGCGDPSGTSEAPPVRTASAQGTGGSGAEADRLPASETDRPSGAGDSDAASGRIQQAFDGMKFYVPPTWKQLPLSTMQMGIVAAKFGMPEIDEEMTLTLSTSGGSLEDNIQRWVGQFSGGQPMRRDTLPADGKEAAVVHLDGTFAAGFGRPPEDDWRMIGVIIPMTGQNYFIKLTGPSDAVSQVEGEFLAFCRSARRE